MKKSFTSLLLALTLMTTTLYSPKSEALVGLLFKSKVVKVIGGIGSAGGATLGIYGYVTAATAGSSIGSVLGGAILMVYGIALGGVGLLVLDDETAADLEFKTIDLNSPEKYNGFEAIDVAIYNSEVEELNAVRKTIASEVNDEENTDDAEALWLEYSYALSPETVAIAEAKAKEFIENFRQ